MAKTSINYYIKQVDTDDKHEDAIYPVVENDRLSPSVLRRSPEALRNRTEVIREAISETFKLFNSDRRLILYFDNGDNNAVLVWNAAEGKFYIGDAANPSNYAQDSTGAYLAILPMITPLSMSGGDLENVPAYVYPVIEVQPEGISPFYIVVKVPVVFGGDRFSFELNYHDDAISKSVVVSLSGTPQDNIVCDAYIPPGDNLTVADIVTAFANLGDSRFEVYASSPSDVISASISRVYATGGIEGEVHIIKPSVFEQFYSDDTKRLDSAFSVLGIYYDKNVDDQSPYGGRLQSFPEIDPSYSTSPVIDYTSLFIARNESYVSLEDEVNVWQRFGRKLPNAIPLAIRKPDDTLELLNGTILAADTHIDTVNVSTVLSLSSGAGYVGIDTSNFNGPKGPVSNGGLDTSSTNLQQVLDDIDDSLGKLRGFTGIITDGSNSSGGDIECTAFLEGIPSIGDSKGIFLYRRGTYIADGSISPIGNNLILGEGEDLVSVEVSTFKTILESSIEFRNIEFRSASLGSDVGAWSLSVSSSSIVIKFKNCVFKDVVLYAYSEVGSIEDVRIIFENCIFEGNSGSLTYPIIKVSQLKGVCIVTGSSFRGTYSIETDNLAFLDFYDMESIELVDNVFDIQFQVNSPNFYKWICMSLIENFRMESNLFKKLQLCAITTDSFSDFDIQASNVYILNNTFKEIKTLGTARAASSRGVFSFPTSSRGRIEGNSFYMVESDNACQTPLIDGIICLYGGRSSYLSICDNYISRVRNNTSDFYLNFGPFVLGKFSTDVAITSLTELSAVIRGNKFEHDGNGSDPILYSLNNDLRFEVTDIDGNDVLRVRVPEIVFYIPATKASTLDAKADLSSVLIDGNIIVDDDNAVGLVGVYVASYRSTDSNEGTITVIYPEVVNNSIVSSKGYPKIFQVSDDTAYGGLGFSIFGVVYIEQVGNYLKKIICQSPKLKGNNVPNIPVFFIYYIRHSSETGDDQVKMEGLLMVDNYGISYPSNDTSVNPIGYIRFAIAAYLDLDRANGNHSSDDLFLPNSFKWDDPNYIYSPADCKFIYTEGDKQGNLVANNVIYMPNGIGYANRGRWVLPFDPSNNSNDEAAEPFDSDDNGGVIFYAKCKIADQIVRL